MTACTSACTGGTSSGASTISIRPGEIIDEGVERQDRQHRLRGLGAGQVVHAQKLAPDRVAGDLIGREIRIRDHQNIAVPHGAQRVQNLGVQPGIDTLEHMVLP